MNIAFVTELRRNLNIILHLHSKLFLMAMIRSAILLGSHRDDLRILNFPFFLPSLPLPEMKVGLMLQFVKQETTTRIEDPVFIQQSAQVLNAQIIFVRNKIGDPHRF
ncbi:hypothetical protein D3C76_1281450 [compost metagenome]